MAIIAGRYRADKMLGAGAMGEVWAGTHIGVGGRVALKRLLPAGSNNAESLARFKREAYLLGRIHSDFVARVLDFVDDKVFGLVLVMELVEGTPLYDLLNQRRFSVEEAVSLGIDIVSGLCDLHEMQIVHRDLKPGNIIIEQRSRGRTRARLVDFGMSRVMQRDDGDDEMTGITRADTALGTLEYMAPEQMLNSRGVTGTADIYAMGVILYRAVAGAHAYSNDSQGGLVRAKLTQDAPTVPTGRTDQVAQSFERIVAKAMCRRPAERYQTAEEMLHDLEALNEQMRASAAPQPNGGGSALMTEESLPGESSAHPFNIVHIEPSGSFGARSSSGVSSIRGVASVSGDASPVKRTGAIVTALLVVVALGAGFAAGTYGPLRDKTSTASAPESGTHLEAMQPRKPAIEKPAAMAAPDPEPEPKVAEPKPAEEPTQEEPTEAKPMAPRAPLQRPNKPTKPAKIDSDGI